MVHEALWRDWLRAAHGVIPAEFAAVPPELALSASQMDSDVDGSSTNSSTYNHSSSPALLSRLWHGFTRLRPSACRGGPAVVQGQNLFTVRAPLYYHTPAQS